MTVPAKGLASRLSFALKSRRPTKVVGRRLRELPVSDRQIQTGALGGSSMSFIAWKILRRLPKPLLLVLLIFVLAAAARA